MKRYFGTLISFLALASGAYAIDLGIHELKFSEQYPMPWFTGPIIAPSGHVVPKGHYNTQPYLFYNTIYSQYDQNWKSHKVPLIHEVLLTVPTKIGLGSKFEIGFTPGFIWRESLGYSTTNITDWIVGLSYQVFDSELKDPWPALKLSVRTSLPFGKYDHLNPKKGKIDVTGDGCFWPSVGLDFSKLIHVYKIHYLDIRFAFNWLISTPITVKGYNAYGGSSNTNAKVYNGDIYTFDLAAQYNLNRNWALAIDLFYQHKNRNHYKGFAGTQEGVALSLNSPSNENFSIAPAIEYNFSENVGIIGGCWFNVSGRNSSAFTTGVISINIYI
jgi:hypothetical protein